MRKLIKLGVNIDHVATLRQARGTCYPDPVTAALLAAQNGADSITLHLREDRRHIQEKDVEQLKQRLNIPMNLEMAATQEMLQFAEKIQPEYCCIVPEKRAELTTEGGLDVAGNFADIQAACKRLHAKNIIVSLFVDPDRQQIHAAKACGATAIELHTGEYADNPEQAAQHVLQLTEMASYAHSLGLIVNAGHGLTLENVTPIAQIPEINELNIGHAIIADAIFVGIGAAVRAMKAALGKVEAGQ